MKRSTRQSNIESQELDAIGALGDPMRRSIFETLAARPRSVRQIADDLPISRPSVSVHLKVMKQAGLVKEDAQGTRRIYRIDPRGIAAMRSWLEHQWASALSGLKENFKDDEDKENDNSANTTKHPR